MREIVPGLWLFDELGRSVNVYLWQRADGYTLIDAGMPWQGYAILKSLGDMGLLPNALDRIIITHNDFDHVGSLAQIKAATGARVVAHAAEAPGIEGKQPRVLPKTVAGTLVGPPFRFLTGVVFRIRPTHVDDMVLEKQVLIEGFQVLHAPGHAPGQIALYHPERKILIAGDALSHKGGKLILPVSLFTPDPAMAATTIRKLARLDVDVLCLGHGEPIVGAAGEQLRAFAATL